MLWVPSSAGSGAGDIALFAWAPRPISGFTIVKSAMREITNRLDTAVSACEIIQMLRTAYCLRRGIYQIFLRELRSLPTDSNDIPVRILAQIDIAVLFFLGDRHIVWLDTVRTYFLPCEDNNADSHNVRKSGQQYCVRGVWGWTGISSFSLFKKVFEYEL